MLVELALEMKKSIPLSSFKLPLGEFRITPDDDNPNITYAHPTSGVNFNVFRNRVTEVRFEPPANSPAGCRTWH